MEVKKGFQEDRAATIIREFEYLKGLRTNEEAHWHEIAKVVWPNQATLFEARGSETTKGEKRNTQLLDPIASLALNRFASILDSLLTPRNQTWHRLVPSDQVLLRDREVQLWFEEVNDTVFKYRYAPKANFSGQNQLVYKSLGGYGTGTMFTDRLRAEPGLRYKHVFLGQVYFAENHQGMIDKAYRYFSMSARQAVQMWGDAVPEEITKALSTTPEREFWFIHAVKPRENVDLERLDFMGMPHESVYVSLTGKKVLEEGGYKTFPYAIPRYEQSPNEVYGRGPAGDALPAIKTLQEQKRVMLRQGHRAVDPVILAHDDGIIDTFSLRPGTIVPGGVSADGRLLVNTLPTGNYEVGMEAMNQERTTINDIFLVTLFQILVENPRMTATEVMERAREKGMLIAPTMGRQQTEYLGPLIEREIDVLEDQGLIPPLPPALLEARGEFKIVYDSPLSRAQRMEEAAGFMRTIESVLQVVNITQNPAPLDHYDWDVIVPEISDINGVPVRWRRGLDVVQQIRQSRAEEAEAAQAAAEAPGQAALINASAKVAE